MKHNTVIYHSADLDGHCSGAIAAAALKEESDLPVVMIGWDYGRPIPYINPTETETLVVTDLCPDAGQMLRWRDTIPRLIWIDHHKTAIEAFTPGELASLHGLREIGQAACELAWRYFHPGTTLPELVRYLGRYDVWDNRAEIFWNDVILPVQYAMRARETDPVDETRVMIWSGWIQAAENDLLIPELQHDGRMLMRYDASVNALIARASAFECLFEGLPAIAMTRFKGGSMAFQTVYRPERHRLMIPVYFTGRCWDYSLYSTHPDIDCSAIAKGFGGGGHRGAAGFRHDHFLLGTPLPPAA